MRARWIALVFTLVGCGSKSSLGDVAERGEPSRRDPEVCNGLDDDGAGGVDDPFRDDEGRYVHAEHCGGCGQPCTPRSALELAVACQVLNGAARCVATECAESAGLSVDGHCVPRTSHLCLACAQDADCGPLPEAACALIDGERRCTVRCTEGDCGEGYQCEAERALCVPVGGSCSCPEGAAFELACRPGAMSADLTEQCVGRSRCDDGQVSACEVALEVCDEQDNDCDGEVDEGFRDERGYGLDPEHCGQCGVSCLEPNPSPYALRCGGDPFAPRCVVACPDELDGLQVGDRLDADLDIQNGCECALGALSDAPGPAGTSGEELDQNCDGADGNVLESYYVAPDGDDASPGSPTRPLRSVSAAIALAEASLATDAPRPHVFVASGAYTETVELRDGVHIYGGYRRDFRAHEPQAYVTEVRAPLGTEAPGGAALMGDAVGEQPTRVAWLRFRGLDASAPASAALAGVLFRPGPQLELTGLVFQAGVPGDGVAGESGESGLGPSALAAPGEAPRAAREDRDHACSFGPANRVEGGAGGRSVCGEGSASGGRGGVARCPVFGAEQASGEPGRDPRGSGAPGGLGGQDSAGPIQNGAGCDQGVCCGLADFTVPTAFHGPSPGENGAVGPSGAGGRACDDPLGAFTSAGVFSPGSAAAGGAGQPGGGGGGGGAGGGVAMDYIEGLCAFADGLGGGGGGGGAGGCGGRGGSPGRSAAPSVGLLLVEPAAFALRGVTFRTSDGGAGGDGGRGGFGGLGGAGALGGSIPPQARVTPTLAAPFPGARGGSGGAGGDGGGGGGGCGGSSVGLWIFGRGAAGAVGRFRGDNIFDLGQGGPGGLGGTGPQPGRAGRDGEARDVVVR